MGTEEDELRKELEEQEKKHKKEKKKSDGNSCLYEAKQEPPLCF